MHTLIKDYNFIYHKQGDHEVVFYLSDVDDTGTIKYFGYLTASGGWIIVQENTPVGTFRYLFGSADYVTNWNARATKEYALFSDAI